MEFNFDHIVGNSLRIQEILSHLKKISRHNVPVLIEGESGTGKELIARAIHYNSQRKNNEFVVINCSAFTDALLESELFGHLKGSFTGAVHEKMGLFEVADNGTFFLDEIADMSPALQVKLLRVVQEGTFLKIGGVSPVKVNVRIIAATNKNLKTMVNNNNFREDLYYRVNVTSLLLPPLRERREDIPLLIEHFLAGISKRMGSPLSVTDEVVELLKQYAWPGNIRQLENEMEKAAIFAHEGVIDKSILSPEITAYEASDEDFGIDSGMSLTEVKKLVYEKIERKFIIDGLEKTQWNKTECAKLLKVSRGDLMRKIAKYGILRS